MMAAPASHGGEGGGGWKSICWFMCHMPHWQFAAELLNAMREDFIKAPGAWGDPVSIDPR